MTLNGPARGQHRTPDDLKDELLALVSHELRSPLTVITGAGRILDRHPVVRSDPGLRVVVDDLVVSTRRMDRVVANMLVLARLSDDHVVAEPLLVRTAVADAVAAAQRDYPQATVRTLGHELRGVAVVAVPAWTKLILLNLLTNAYLYGDRAHAVVVDWGLHGDAVDIHVCNAGDPVNPDVFARWFEPFYRSERPAADSPGAGLGLTVARTLARSQGGDLVPGPWATGPGTMMTLTLPVAATG